MDGRAYGYRKGLTEGEKREGRRIKRGREREREL